MKYQTFVFDLDGTLYRGDTVIEDAAAFVQAVKQEGVNCLYVTNNSSKTPKQVLEKLVSMNIPARLEEVYTSSLATAAYIQRDAKTQGNTQPKAYVIGEEGLLAALQNAGIQITDQSPDYVIVGIDRQFHYDKLKTASQWVYDGATLVGTNPDRALPVVGQLLPGAGSIMQSVVTATGVDPIWIGKPAPIILQYALENQKKSIRNLRGGFQNVLVIGDNMETDIGAAAQLGLDSVLVLTGFTKQEQVRTYSYQPTRIASSLTDCYAELFGKRLV